MDLQMPEMGGLEATAHIRDIEQELRHRTPDWPKQMAAWEQRVGVGSALSGGPIDWAVVKVQNDGDNSQRYVYHEDGSQSAWGYAPTKWSSVFSGPTDVGRITGIRLEVSATASASMRS